MTTEPLIDILTSGVPNLDAVLGGGLPSGCVTVLAGPPGSGKTILAQQIGFHRAAAGGKVLFIQTLSEPTVKTLKYVQQFSFFDRKQLLANVQFIDLGATLKKHGLEAASAQILEALKREKPTMVVIDSFRAFDDKSTSPEEQRNFSYQLAVNLIAWQCTALLLGEFGARDIETNPIFSVVDALIVMNQVEVVGEQQRRLQIIKMRGAAHNREKHPFVITAAGIELYPPQVLIKRQSMSESGTDQPRRLPERIKTGIGGLDNLLGKGITRGSSLLVGGDSGSGKTVLLLEFILRGARDLGEQGLFISFEETPARLRETAHELGWDLGKEVKAGRIELLFIPPSEVLIEADLLMIKDKLAQHATRRLAIDSLSGFLHKISDHQVARERLFQLASIVHNAEAVAMISTNYPTGTRKMERFQQEATSVDGVILLTQPEEGLKRSRYIEVYKLRNTEHSQGKKPMTIGTGGLTISAT